MLKEFDTPHPSSLVKRALAVFDTSSSPYESPPSSFNGDSPSGTANSPATTSVNNVGRIQPESAGGLKNYVFGGTSGSFTTLLDVTGRGTVSHISIASAANSSTFTYKIRVTIDGNIVAHHSASLIYKYGFAVIGSIGYNNTYDSLYWSGIEVPFYESLKIEVSCSYTSTGTLGFMYCHYKLVEPFVPSVLPSLSIGELARRIYNEALTGGGRPGNRPPILLNGAKSLGDAAQTSHEELEQSCVERTSCPYTFASYTTILEVSGSGILHYLAGYNNYSSSFSGGIRLTIDGVEVFSYAATVNADYGFDVVGLSMAQTSYDRHVIAFDAIPFKSSLKIEASLGANYSNAWMILYDYMLKG